MNVKEEDIKSAIMHALQSCLWTYHFSERCFVLMDGTDCFHIIYYPPINVGFNEDSPFFNTATLEPQKYVIVFSDVALNTMKEHLKINTIAPHAFHNTKVTIGADGEINFE